MSGSLERASRSRGSSTNAPRPQAPQALNRFLFKTAPCLLPQLLSKAAVTLVKQLKGHCVAYKEAPPPCSSRRYVTASLSSSDRPAVEVSRSIASASVKACTPPCCDAPVTCMGLAMQHRKGFQLYTMLRPTTRGNTLPCNTSFDIAVYKHSARSQQGLDVPGQVPFSLPAFAASKLPPLLCWYEESAMHRWRRTANRWTWHTKDTPTRVPGSSRSELSLLSEGA